MNIAVIGSGAMGSLYGGLLAADGATVTLFDVWREHVEAIRTTGLTMETPDGTVETIPVDATTDPEEIGTIDLAILFVKSNQTRVAIEGLEQYLDSASVLTLQNGLGNPKEIATNVDRRSIIAGVTAHGSTLIGPGHIRHAGRGPTVIGNYFVENDERVTTIANRFESAEIETTVSTNVEQEIWEKVAVNVGINAASALANVPNGDLSVTEPGSRLLEAAVSEFVSVADAEGHKIREDIVAHVRDVAQETGANKSSMRQDLEGGRRTEIETLNGEIVRRAERHGIDVPVNRTLADLIRLAER